MNASCVTYTTPECPVYTVASMYTLPTHAEVHLWLLGEEKRGLGHERKIGSGETMNAAMLVSCQV